MGKKRLPTKLKIIKGTHRPCRENQNEPVYETTIPEPPIFLNKYAKEEWLRLSQVLFNQGLLADVDMAALSAYCQAYGRWAEAENQLKEQEENEGKAVLTITTISGNVINNPLIGIANKAALLMKQFLVEFGMTPASRAKVSAKKSKWKSDPWSKFG